MIRLVITFLVYMIVGRWIYSEVQLAFPKAVPSVNYALETVAIPTHDKWNGKKVSSFMHKVTAQVEQIGVSFAKADEQDTHSARRAEAGFERF